MITEDYVSFETAKLLKEKGFDESISMVYMSHGNLCKCTRYDSICNSNYNDITKNYFECTAPTHQMAMKWLRVEHNLCIAPYAAAYRYGFTIDKADTGSNLGNEKKFYPHKEFETYEEAVEAALKYTLENLI